ncbi:MAG: DNA repair protein RecO [Candidatus Cloacimonetes bacterium]|nr:DNA repair protein RecO [Candidatus Cloacimonadota bacterium]
MTESRYITSRCIVLRVTDYSETSYILLLLSKDFGLISAIAKGAKKQSSKFFSVFGLLNEFEGEFSRSPNSELLTVINASLIKSYLPGLKYGTVQLLSAGAELIRQSVIDEKESEDYYRLFYNYLSFLPSVEKNQILIFWRYVYSYLKLEGITLVPDNCSHCASKLSNTLFYSNSIGGFICSSCLEKEAILRDLSNNDRIITLTGVTAEIMQKLPSIGNYLEDIAVTPTTYNLINKLLLSYLRFHLNPQINFVSLKHFSVQ